MRVLYIEGVAIHGGPESCVGVREDGDEALTGGVRAGLLSREMTLIGVPTSSQKTEGHVCGDAIASRRGTLRGHGNLGTYADLHAREPGGPVVARGRWWSQRLAGREGNALAVSPR